MGSRAHLLAAVCTAGCSFSAAGKGGGDDTEGTSSDSGTTAMVTGADDGVGPGDDADTTGDDGPPTTDDGPPTTDDDPTDATEDSSTSGPAVEWESKRHIAWSSQALALDAEVDVPVLLRLDSTLIDYEAMAPDGSDLRFFDESETELLAYDIELWDPEGTSLVWVLVPDKPAGSGDGFWMYYGSPDAPSGEDEVAAWTTGMASYVGVWHMTEDPGAAAPQFIDVTGNGNDGTAMGLGAGAVDSAPQFGPAISFDGSAGQRIEVPDSDALTFADGFLVEALVDVSVITMDQFRSAVRKNNGWALNALEMGYTGPRAVVWDSNTTAFTIDGMQIDAGVHYLAMSLSYDDLDQARLVLFVDGVETSIYGSFSPQNSPDPLVLGWQLPGSIFEAHVSATPRRTRFLSLQWLGLQNDLVVFGDAEPA